MFVYNAFNSLKATLSTFCFQICLLLDIHNARHFSTIIAQNKFKRLPNYSSNAITSCILPLFCNLYDKFHGSVFCSHFETTGLQLEHNISFVVVVELWLVIIITQFCFVWLLVIIVTLFGCTFKIIWRIFNNKTQRSYKEYPVSGSCNLRPLDTAKISCFCSIIAKNIKLKWKSLNLSQPSN